MKIRSLHRLIGLILLLPFFGWAITGFIFFIKPGYTEAYESLVVKMYPLSDSITITPGNGWKEFRYVKTILGDHLLARTDSGWVHLDPSTKTILSKPTENEIKSLLTDAITANSQRYGDIKDISENTITTITGVTITLDWNRLSLYQKGKDTDRIDSFYKIHYLQWTGIKTLDRIIGVVGLILVIVLTGLGVWIAFRPR